MEKKRARSLWEKEFELKEFDSFGEWVYKYPKGSIQVREALLPKMKKKRKRKHHSLAFITAKQLLRMETNRLQALERQRARRKKRKKDKEAAELREISGTSAFE